MNNSKIFLGIVSAAVVGAVIGILCAPEDGEKTRKKIKKSTNNLATELLDALEKSKEKAKMKVDELKEKGEGYMNRAKSKTDDITDDVEALKNEVQSI